MSLWQMSVSGAVMILVILVLRALLLERLPKKTFLLLWEIALARLLVPFSVPFGGSFYALVQHGAQTVTRTDRSAAGVQTLVGRAPEGVTAGTAVPPHPAAAQTAAVPGWTLVWLVGALLLAAFFAAAYWKSWQKFQMSFPVEQPFARQWLQAHPLRRTVSIRQCAFITSPLTFGVRHPVILLPKKTDWQDKITLQYVLEHEFVHIRRFDAVTKLLLMAAVCVHWFNPFAWGMYILANRDLELACDEAVLRRFGRDARADYARALIRMEETRNGFAPLCSSFSGNAMEERIVAIMKTGKTTIVSVLLAGALVVGTTTAFATSAPASTEELDRQMNQEASHTISEEETMMSYVDPDDGKTYYSFDNGKTFTPLTDAEYEQLYPTQDIEWWTYDEYKAWLDNEKVQLQSMLGERGSVNGGEEFVWTQEKIDETIALYEETLQDIKNGMVYSKTVDGQDDMLVVYNPADREMGTAATTK